MEYINVFNKIDQDLSNKIENLQRQQEELIDQKKHLLEAKQKVHSFLSDAYEVKQVLGFKPELINSLQQELNNIFQGNTTQTPEDVSVKVESQPKQEIEEDFSLPEETKTDDFNNIALENEVSLEDSFPSENEVSLEDPFASDNEVSLEDSFPSENEVSLEDPFPLGEEVALNNEEVGETETNLASEQDDISGMFDDFDANQAQDNDDMFSGLEGMEMNEENPLNLEETDDPQMVIDTEEEEPIKIFSFQDPDGKDTSF